MQTIKNKKSAREGKAKRDAKLDVMEKPSCENNEQRFSLNKRKCRKKEEKRKEKKRKYIYLLIIYIHICMRVCVRL